MTKSEAGTDTGAVENEEAGLQPLDDGTVGDHDATPRQRSARGPVSRTTFRSVAALAALFLVGALVLLVLLVSLNSKYDRDVKGRQKVEEVSGQFASRLLTYDFNNLDKAKQSVLELSTGKFRNEYEQAFRGLQALIQTAQAKSTGTVNDVYVAKVEGNNAKAIVVVNNVVEGSSGKRSISSYVELTLVRVGGNWKVDGVTNLNFGQSGGTAAAPGSTTAPAGAPALAPATTAPPAAPN